MRFQNSVPGERYDGDPETKQYSRKHDVEMVDKLDHAWS